MNNKLLVFVLLLFTSYVASGQRCRHILGEWRQVQPMPYYHIEGAKGIVGNKIYSFTGFNSDKIWTMTNRLDIYDVITNTWTAGPTTPFFLSHVLAATDGRRYIWTAGGYAPGSVFTREVWRYDTQTQTFMRFPDLPQPRAAGAFVLAENNLHWIGGIYSRINDTTDHYVLKINEDGSPQGDWTNATPLPQKKNHFQGVYLDGKIYTPGGIVGYDVDPIDLSEMEAFDVRTNTWQYVASMPAPRSHFDPSTILMDNHIVAISGGIGIGYNPMPTNVEYEVETNTWTYLNRDLPIAGLSPLAGYFKNITLATGEHGDFLVVFHTSGMIGWISKVDFQCTGPAPSQSPSVAPSPSVVPSASVAPSTSPEISPEPSLSTSPAVSTEPSMSVSPSASVPPQSPAPTKAPPTSVPSIAPSSSPVIPSPSIVIEPSLSPSASASIPRTEPDNLISAANTVVHNWSSWVQAFVGLALLARFLP